MKIDHHQERINAIKTVYVAFPTECSCCNEEYVDEEMYSVERWGVNRSVNTWYYCKTCVHSKEEVLHEIDTDTGDGIAFIDSFGHYPEKDYTKIMSQRMPDPNGVQAY